MAYNDNIFDDGLNFIKESAWAKAGVIIAGSLLGLYLLTQAFHITAGAVRGYNNLHSALNGN